MKKYSALQDDETRRQLSEHGLEAPHLVIAVTPDSEVILRSNVSPDVLRAFGQDLIAVADELEAESEPDKKHYTGHIASWRACCSGGIVRSTK